METLTLPTRPAPLPVDLAKAAVVVVDMRNQIAASAAPPAAVRFIKERGSFA